MMLSSSQTAEMACFALFCKKNWFYRKCLKAASAWQWSSSFGENWLKHRVG